MKEFTYKRLNLQMFGGEGGTGGAAASAGGEGTGAVTVGTADDDGQQALRALGVPEELLQKRAKSFSAKQKRAPEIATQTQQTAMQEPAQQDAVHSPLRKYPGRRSRLLNSGWPMTRSSRKKRTGMHEI